MFGKLEKTGGFTLVELLLVIVIIGIIALIVVQQFDVSEASAKTAVSDFNQAVVEKSISDYQSVHGVYPSGFHTGLDAAAATKSVPGLSQEAALNLASDGTAGQNIAAGAITNGYTNGCQVNTLGANVKALSADQARALREWGIHRFAVGGYTSAVEKGTQTPLDTAGLVCWVLTGGKDLYRGGTLNWDGSGKLGTEAVTINGRALSTWQWGSEAVVLAYVTGDVDWTAVYKGNPDETGWGTMTAKSKIALAKPPLDPKAVVDSNFKYYLAAFYLSPSQIGSKVGYSCRLLGLLDANLHPVNP